MRILCLLLALLLVGGCGTENLLGGPPVAHNSAPSGERCAEIFSAPDGTRPPKSVTVLLSDGSASGFSKEDQTRRQDWGAMLAGRFPQGGDVLVSVGVFGGSVDWKFQKVTPGASTDDARTSNDAADARACFAIDLTQALKSAPGRPQTDVLRALAEGAEQVRAQPGQKSIYIATDGLSNTGCADLRAAPIGDHTAIPGIVQGCGPELPKLDKNFRVQFIGLGNPGKGWSDVGTPHRVWLVELWRKLCEATGATCADPVTEAPSQTQADGIRLPADADVRIPKIKILPGNPTVLSVPSSVLFDVDSAKLATGRAQESVEQILDYLKGVHFRKIEIAGHTDSTGTPEHNRKLSTDRANAVLRALSARGITALTAVGYGEKKPSCTPEFKNNVADRVAMACNRRVEIIVYT
jgi:OmpA-OmpF porin, OOP family